MNSLDIEQQNNRKLYRELFLKAYDGFKKQIDSIKPYFSCQNCASCCKIRYTNLSPAEINDLKNKDEAVSKEYIELFLPYGAKEGFDYEKNNQIDIELNNREAKKVAPEYVNLVISKSSESIYFYFCKNLNDNGKCKLGNKRHSLCLNFPQSVTTILPKACNFRNWQKAAIDKIEKEISKDIFLKIEEIKAYRNNFQCKKTGTCCRLASSEFSYEELKQKAKNGDNFATQFTSVFIPYKNLEEAREQFPEFVDFVLSSLQGENIYFYHCPHVTEDNLCSMYENRPQICKDFPDNPLSVLPPVCGFYQWKEEVYVAAMLMHALIEISDFTKEKIKFALEE